MKSLNNLMGKRGFEVNSRDGIKVYIIKAKIVYISERDSYRKIAFETCDQHGYVLSLETEETYEKLVEYIEL